MFSRGSFLAITVVSHIILLFIYLRQLCTVKGSPYEIPNDILAEESAQNGKGTTRTLLGKSNRLAKMQRVSDEGLIKVY